MTSTIRNLLLSRWTLAASVLLSQPQVTHGGWTGQMNGTGAGKTTVSVRSPDGTLVSAVNQSLTGPSISAASAAIKPDGYVSFTQSPKTSSTTTSAKSIGSAGYIWKNALTATGGDSTDNTEIQNRITIIPVDCASLDVETSAVIAIDGKSGVINVVASATGGTAMLLRGYEVLDGGGAPTDLTDRTRGALRWEMLLVGPFNYDGACPLRIPFTIETDINNLYFASDGVAVSRTFSIECPADIEVGCFDQLTEYPLPNVTGGCGEVTVAFAPSIDQLVAGPNLVTATATDEAGNQVSCSFTVTRHPLEFNGFFSPIDGLGQSCDSPLRTIKKGSNVPVKFTTSCDGQRTFSGQTPRFEVWKCSTQTLVESGYFKEVANEWHFNWVTDRLTPNTTYRLTAILQDGTRKEVFVKIK